VILLRPQALTSRVPALLDVSRLLWLVSHHMLAAFAVCVTAAAASTLSARVPMAARAGVASKAVLAGRNLILGTLYWGRRGGAARRVRITERDLRLLALLLDVNFLSASQLVMLGWGPFGERAGQRRLKLLHDGGYVDRFRPVCGAGSHEWNYRLAARGWEELAAARLTQRRPRYTPPAIANIDHIQHDLELAGLVLCIALDAGGELRAGLLDRMPFEWRGPHRGRIRAIGSEWAERSDAAKLERGTRLHPESSRRDFLKPDATLIGGPPGSRFAVLIEYDRTLRPHKHADRLRRYDAWFVDGWRHTRFATNAIPPVVVFLTAYEALLGHLIQAADRVLSAWYGHPEAGPRKGVHPARERIVFTSRERILRGDWTVQRAPSLPQGSRERPNVCTPRSLVYDLPAALAAGAVPPSYL
jgi:hypothetical protein